MTPPNGNGLAAAELQATAQGAAAPPVRAEVQVGPGAFSLLRIIASVGAIQVLTMGFTLVRSKIAAVILGPQGVGAISLIDQITALVAQAFTLSLPFAAIKFLSSAHSENYETFSKLYIAFLRLLLIVSLVGTVSGVLLLFFKPVVLGRDLAVYGGIAILAFLTIPATNLTALLTNTMAAARRVHASAVYGAIAAGLLGLLAAAGTLLRGLNGYYVGTLIGALFAVLGGLVYLARAENLRIHRSDVRLVDELRRYPNVATFAASLYVISFSLPIAYLVARYAVLRSQGLEAAGLLQSAMALGLALFAVMRQSNALFLTPMLNRTGAPEEKFRQAMDYLRMFALMIGMIALPLVLFPELWLYLLYSKRFLVAAPFVYLFVVAQAVELVAGVNMGLLVGLDQIGTQVWVTLCGLAGLAAASWYLVPHWGIAGVGAAMLVDGVVVFNLAAWKLWSGYRLPIYRAMGWLPVGVIALVAACGALATRLGGFAPGHLALKGCIWMMFTVVTLRATRTREGHLLGELLRKAGVN